MSILTPFFNLIKPAKNDPAAIAQINSNMDTIDTEMHRPPLTVNEIEPDPETRDIQITTVPLADNLTSSTAQINSGTFILRTTAGEASITDGPANLADIKGNMVKTGYVPESITPTFIPSSTPGQDPITDISVDRDTFVNEFETQSATSPVVFTYSSDWDVAPSSYGITFSGTPVSGDKISVAYVQENRGTITTASPSSFVSTGWNLYNHASGYARVLDYSEQYGFKIDGTYTGLKFSETLTGTQTTITPVDGYFTVPADGYLFVTGGNDTDTAVWMTWTNWTEEANGGVFQAYSQTTIDLSGVMVNFPDGLMRVGTYADEINLNTGRAYSRIEKIQYTESNLEGVIASGVPYDTDTNYIYAVREEPASFSITLEGAYTANDHGLEMFLGTTVPVTGSFIYGDNLKDKLRTDVLTISQQTLDPGQKAQVQQNLGIDSIVAGTPEYTYNSTTSPYYKTLKFPNGVMIEIARISKSVSFNNSWGGLYDQSEGWALGNWPVPFIDTPYISALVTSTKGAFIERIYNTSKTAIGETILARAASGSQTIAVQITGIGLWKAQE